MLRQAGEEDVLVFRDGHPIVLMTPFDDDDLTWYAREQILRSWPRWLKHAARSNGEKRISHGELKKELGLD